MRVRRGRPALFPGTPFSTLAQSKRATHCCQLRRRAREPAKPWGRAGTALQKHDARKGKLPAPCTPGNAMF